MRVITAMWLQSISVEIFCSCFLGAVLLCPCFAYGNQAEGEYPLQSPLAVHTVVVSVGGQCCAEFNLSTQVGYVRDGVCQYQRETPKQVVSSCDVIPFGVFKLDGRRLEQLVGNNWTCAATHLHTFSEDGFDRYLLVKNQQNHYISSTPASGRVSLSLCP